MNNFRARPPLLIGLLLLGLAWAGFTWLASGSSDGNASRQPNVARGPNKTPDTRRSVGAPRSLQGLTVDTKQDITADALPPDVRRESIIRMGVEEVREIEQMNLAVFDNAAGRWNSQLRVKEFIVQWRELEAAWKTQDDEAKAAVLPRMEAMWKEVVGLLREEVEKSAREAAAGVK